MLTDRVEHSTNSRPSGNDARSWREYISDIYFELDVVLGNNEFVNGAVDKREFSNLTVSSYRGSPHGTRRTRQLICRDKVEHHVFVLPISGHFDCRQRGREAKSTAGMMYVVNGAEPYEVDMYGDAHMVAVAIPCKTSRTIFRDVDDLCCQEGIGDPLFINTLATFIQSTLHTRSQMDPDWLRQVCCQLIDWALHPLYSQSKERRSADVMRDMLLGSLRQSIGRHLHEQDFGIDTAAQSCGVSKRHLQSVLQATGSTFTRELNDARLMRAAQCLRSSRRGPKQIGQIAYECGFRSQGYFSSLYREKFGVAPREEAPAPSRN